MVRRDRNQRQGDQCHGDGVSEPGPIQSIRQRGRVSGLASQSGDMAKAARTGAGNTNAISNKKKAENGICAIVAPVSKAKRHVCLFLSVAEDNNGIMKGVILALLTPLGQDKMKKATRARMEDWINLEPHARERVMSLIERLDFCNHAGRPHPTLFIGVFLFNPCLHAWQSPSLSFPLSPFSFLLSLQKRHLQKRGEWKMGLALNWAHRITKRQQAEKSTIFLFSDFWTSALHSLPLSRHRFISWVMTFPDWCCSC